MSIELVKLGQVFFIHNDIDLYYEEQDLPIQCRALNITEDLGQIQYIFSDKTGTLTENKMVFRRCTIGGKEFSHQENGNSYWTKYVIKYRIQKMSLKLEKLSFHFSKSLLYQIYRKVFRNALLPHIVAACTRQIGCYH